jgi:large repetitive protein
MCSTPSKWLATLLCFVCFSFPVRATTPGAFVYTGNLLAAGANETATVLANGDVLITGGSGAISGTAELYVPATGVFSTTGNMTVARVSGYTATLLTSGLVLIVGGATETTDWIANAELYNPTTGEFSATGSLNYARAGHTATLLSNGEVLIAGGIGPNGRVWSSLSSAELYNPATGTFSVTGTMVEGVGYHSATLLNNGTVLLAGGYTDVEGGVIVVQSAAQLYNPLTGTFTATGSLNVARAGQTATILNNGTVLIAAGFTVSYSGETRITSSLASSEIYNPSTGTFSVAASLNSARYGQASALLNNGTVLIAGGYDSASGTYLATAELYSPSANTFALTGAMNVSRSGAAAVRLENGNFLVTGGANATYEEGVSTAELYQPTSLTPSGLTSITLTPTTPWIPIGNSENFVATGTVSGVEETLASVTWSSSSASVATITNDATNSGNAFGLTAGSTTIEACAGSVCGSTSVNVAEHQNLILGSECGDSSSGTFEEYDDSGNLLRDGNLENALSGQSATLLQNGTIFVAGGSGGVLTNCEGDSTLWQIFTPEGQVLSSGSLLDARNASPAVLLANGNVFIASGKTASPGTWEIHSPTGALVADGDLNNSRGAGAAAVRLQNGDVWISGGPEGTGSACTWEIHDSSGNLLSDGSLTTCFPSGKVFVLSNGDVILLGGFDAPSSYEIHSETGAFVTSGSLTDPFDGNGGGVLLGGNNVFLFENGYWEYVGFSGTTKTFDNVGTLLDSRVGARAVVTSTGNIFITGGTNSPGTWEIWEPSGETAILVADGSLFDTRYAGHSDTHF